MKKSTLILFIIFITCPLLLAQTKQAGKIMGVITDVKTHTPLPGVNVIIKGTYMGAATDLNGEYFITNISPGQYDLEASMIGYKIQLKTGIKVLGDNEYNV